MCSKARLRAPKADTAAFSSTMQQYAKATRDIAGHIVSSARDGQLLPRLTIVLAIHCALHMALFFVHWIMLPIFVGMNGLKIYTYSPAAIQTTFSTIPFRNVSRCLLAINLTLNIAGYILIYKLYQHSVTTIFNRIPPRFPSPEFVSSFGAHIALLRPLQIIFRYLTARSRVLPDVIVLGEVRCGTTTLCQHLSELPGCHLPFCLWKHPELDGKECFYFVGHYLGYVTPQTYRMCFPLRITKWWNERVLGRPFFTYDGCAQYLTSPTAAALIAETYRQAGQDPPVLVACVRDPVDQAVSWWRYENNAMEWGASMGLSGWNTALRTTAYPPRSIGKALEFSSSEAVRGLYADAEDLMKVPQHSTKQGRQKGLQRSPLAVQHRYQLPSWAITWPGGQLSTIGRNGLFAFNIERYERTFEKIFSDNVLSKEGRKADRIRTLNHVTVVSIEYMSSGVHLKDTLVSITSKMAARRYRDKCGSRYGREDSTIVCKAKEMASMYKVSIEHIFNNTVKVRRNSGTKLSSADMEPDSNDHVRLAQFFADETRKLGLLAGLNFEDLGWKVPNE